MRFLFSLLIWLLAIVSMAVFFIPYGLVWIVAFPFDKRRVVNRRLTMSWGRYYTWLIPGWKVSIEGEDNINPDRVYIILSNHQSLADIVILNNIRYGFTWVSKIENFRVPFLGWVMVMNRDIKLRRGSLSSIKRMMKDSLKELDRGNSILIFPEGTRSLDGEIGPFRDGAFKIAETSKLPILPIVVDGSGNALPKRSIIIKGKHRMHIRILEPVDPNRFNSVKELKEEMRALYIRELKRLRMDKMNS